MLQSAMDVAVLAQDEVNTGGAMQWIKDNIFGLLILAGACVVGGGAMKGNFAKVMTVSALLLVGVLWFTIASTGNFETIGNWLMGLIGLGG